MITLEEYKRALISRYRYKIDDCESRRLKREEILNRDYPDEYLNKVISDTYSVIRDIFDIDTIKYGYCKIDLRNTGVLNDISSKELSLNLVGGFSSDTLYIEESGRIISHYILEQTFGKYLIISEDVDEIEFETDDPDILSYDYHFYLYLQRFPDNMDEIKKDICGVSKIKK